MARGVDFQQHRGRRDDDQRDENEELFLIPERSNRHHLPISDCGAGKSVENSFRSRSTSAAPRATHNMGCSACVTGIPVINCNVSARPKMAAPPPAKTMPFSER